MIHSAVQKTARVRFPASTQQRKKLHTESVQPHLVLRAITIPVWLHLFDMVPGPGLTFVAIERTVRAANQHDLQYTPSRIADREQRASQVWFKAAMACSPFSTRNGVFTTTT